MRYLLVSEVTEMFMQAQGKGWFGAGNEGSAGEGLSRYLAGQFLIANSLGVTEPGFALANSWMASPRADYVNNVDPLDHGIDAKTGCAILFIDYLHTQLGFDTKAIVGAAATELSGVYKNLTGDHADPFPRFKALLDGAYPGTTTIPGSNPDNPFPIFPTWGHFDLTAAAGATSAVSEPSGYAFEGESRQHVVYRGADNHVHELAISTGVLADRRCASQSPGSLRGARQLCEARPATGTGRTGRVPGHAGTALTRWAGFPARPQRVPGCRDESAERAEPTEWTTQKTAAPPAPTETAMTTTSTLSGRDRAILRAVAAGGAELQLGTEPDLFLDGLCCCDQTATRHLVRAGLIAAATLGLVGERVAATLTAAGQQALGVTPLAA